MAQSFKLGRYYRLAEVNLPLCVRRGKRLDPVGWFVHLLFVCSFERDTSGGIKVRDSRCMLALQRGGEKVQNRLIANIAKPDLREFMLRMDEFGYLSPKRKKRKSKVNLYNLELWQNFGRRLGKHFRKNNNWDDLLSDGMQSMDDYGREVV